MAQLTRWTGRSLRDSSREEMREQTAVLAIPGTAEPFEHTDCNSRRAETTGPAILGVGLLGRWVSYRLSNLEE